MNSLIVALDAMLQDDENISARGVLRRLPDVFKHASDITRHAERRQALENYQERQTALRSLMEKANKQSKTSLTQAIERKNREIEILTRQRDLLIASHKAMILAVSEMGGRKAWLRFFEQYQACVEELEALGAMQNVSVSVLHHPHMAPDVEES
jgi:hypothetical protein